MKNIPFFTTEHGIASLTLEEISFNKTAYIRVQSSVDLEKILQDCLSFCRAVGAEEVYATGDFSTERYGDGASIVQMARLREGIEPNDGLLVPVNADNLEQFRAIYNKGMYHVPNASGMSMQNASEVLEEQSGYFVYAENELIGIGIAAGEWIHAIVSLKRGMGEFIMHALNQVLTGPRIRVEVIESNVPAMHLYKRMGFVQYNTVSSWYKIFPCVK